MQPVPTYRNGCLLVSFFFKSHGLTVLSSANKSGTGGNATESRDSAGGAAKQQKEFPEAPDAIGMQDERGGRGG
jgi:hypothetical protein